MLTVINEPTVEYKLASWQSKLKISFFETFICGIENGTILSCPPSGSSYIFYSEKPKNKLSALRGKLAKQSSKEIDHQIAELRKEWNRNI